MKNQVDAIKFSSENGIAHVLNSSLQKNWNHVKRYYVWTVIVCGTESLPKRKMWTLKKM
jgi:hypothetical protein